MIKLGAGILKQLTESLINNIKALLVGGHGSTTDTLCFAYILLSTHPDFNRCMLDEHHDVFGTSKLEEIESMLLEQPGKLGELAYTTAVINETLRLFPVGFGVRVVPEGMTIQYNSRTYPLTHPDHGGQTKLVVIPVGSENCYCNFISNRQEVSIPCASTCIAV